MTPLQIFSVPRVSRRRRRSSQRHELHDPDLSDRRARRAQTRLAFATVIAAAIVFYDGLQVHIVGHSEGFELAFALAFAMLAQGWTTSRASSTVRWVFVTLLATAAVLSFAGFTVFTWTAKGAFLMVPTALVLAAIGTWVAASTNLRVLAHERVTHRVRSVERGPRLAAGIVGGVLFGLAVAILVGYSLHITLAVLFPLILAAIAVPPLYLAATGKDFATWRISAMRVRR